ncbi:MAG: hypothetical protein ACI8XC_003027, partial [Gammaproteobacteria bacterium]
SPFIRNFQELQALNNNDINLSFSRIRSAISMKNISFHNH